MKVNVRAAIIEFDKVGSHFFRLKCPNCSENITTQIMPFQDANEALKHHSEESFSRLVVSMEEKFEESLKAEKEQMELAFKLKAKDHDLYDRLANSPITTRANSRRASLAKISSMSDLLALKAPTLESLEAMGPEELKQKFIVLMDHFYAAVDEIRALRARLSKAQDTIGKSNYSTKYHHLVAIT